MKKILGTLIAVLAVVAVAAGAWLAWTRLAPPAASGQATYLTPGFQALAAHTPTPQPTAAVPNNLLINPSFEGNFITWGSANNVAPGWRSWYLALPPCQAGKDDCWIPCPSNCLKDGKCQSDYGCYWQQPEFAEIRHDQYDYRIHTGDKAQKYFSFSRMHEGGLYQQVSGITPGTPLEFSAWMQAWMCYDPKKTGECEGGRVSNAPAEMHLRIGLDPTGGTVPTSTNIVWSAEQWAFDQWIYFSVQAVAQASTVTVFTHSRPDWDWARINNDVYLDDANLVAVAAQVSAVFSSIRPAQPELGQPTTVQVTSNDLLPDATLTITDPLAAPVAPIGEGVAGSRPYTWTWRFTPTQPGVHTLAFRSSALAAPITTTLRAVAAVRLSAWPSTPWLNQTVTVQASAYYPYIPALLTVTTPAGGDIFPWPVGIHQAEGVFTRTWQFTSSETGAHRVAFNHSKLSAPATTSVHLVSQAGVHADPPAPPLDTPVTVQAWAYYAYANAALALTDPNGAALAPINLGRSGAGPFVWAWVFTPTLAGAYRYAFTADRLDEPAGGLVFAGGQAVYLPFVVK